MKCKPCKNVCYDLGNLEWYLEVVPCKQKQTLWTDIAFFLCPENVICFNNILTFLTL